MNRCATASIAYRAKSFACSGALYCLLPYPRSPIGPVTARRLARLGFAYGLVSCAALLLARSPDIHWQAFALGMTVPGAGFLLHAGSMGDWGGLYFMLALLSMALFGASLWLWFATGNALAPPLVWIVTAAGAAWLRPEAGYAAATQVVPLVILWLLGVAAATLVIHAGIAGSRRREANCYLVARAAGVSAVSCDAPVQAQELSPAELQLMRFLLDRALQPLANFEGFEWIDQYQTAAVRYQLNFAGYALAMAQATRLPAFDAWLGEAQRRLIDKQTDPRIWGYWRVENLWGNLDGNPDPVARDNIMYSGFCAAQIAMFHAASARRDYAQPGRFAPGRGAERYEHSLQSLIACLDRGFHQSSFTLMACEPNWIYPLCNTIGASAMLAHDRMAGASVWTGHAARFRSRFEAEFIDAAGRIVPCRSSYTGLALPCVGGAQPQALPCVFLNAILPDIAMRQWLLLRRRLYQNEQREDALNHKFFWRIDTGNYRFSRAAAYASTALAAKEMGDSRVAALCFAALDTDCPPTLTQGRWYRPRASVWAHAVEFFARVCERDAFRSLIHRPRAAGGMHVATARYPDVLCALATRTKDALTAVFYPGREPGLHEIGLAGLVPGAAYRCEGAAVPGVIADAERQASVNVMLAGRSVLQVRRQG